VTNDLDTLATALHARIDDELKDSPWLAPWRPAVGITPTLSDAELVTLAVMSALLGRVPCRGVADHPAVVLVVLGSAGALSRCSAG
jgi:hypothetical protein